MNRELKKRKQSNDSAKIILISIIVYALVLLAHYIYMQFINPDFNIIISDQVNFYNRGKGILYGKIPYRDFYSNAAPLSSYLWAPLVFVSMIGSSDFSSDFVSSMNFVESPSMMLLSYVIRLFFVSCIIISALILYRLEDNRKNKHAYTISLTYCLNPFFLYLTSFWGSDECIVPLLILLPIYLFEKGNNTLATLCIVLGAGLKYFPIFLAPLIWIYSKRWSERIFQTLLFLVGLLVITLPFYLVSPENFLNQFEDSLSDYGNQGILTLIQSNSEILLDPYNFIFQILAVSLVCLFGLYFFLIKEKWSYLKTSTLLLLFLLLYPKIQISYIVMVFPFIFIALFEKGSFRWISGIFYLTGALAGRAAWILIDDSVSSVFWKSVCWINMAIFYLSMIISVFLFMRFERTKLGEIKKKATIIWIQQE